MAKVVLTGGTCTVLKQVSAAGLTGTTANAEKAASDHSLSDNPSCQLREAPLSG